MSVNLNVVEDGVEAIDYLQKTQKYAEKPHLDLILLDLELAQKRLRRSAGTNQVRSSFEANSYCRSHHIPS
jgi:CheY-like chemotaxis protein